MQTSIDEWHPDLSDPWDIEACAVLLQPTSEPQHLHQARRPASRLLQDSQSGPGIEEPGTSLAAPTFPLDELASKSSSSNWRHPIPLDPAAAAAAACSMACSTAVGRVMSSDLSIAAVNAYTNQPEDSLVASNSIIDEPIFTDTGSIACVSSTQPSAGAFEEPAQKLRKLTTAASIQGSQVKQELSPPSAARHAVSTQRY